MSSDSEEDFQSADEGSDSELYSERESKSKSPPAAEPHTTHSANDNSSIPENENKSNTPSLIEEKSESTPPALSSSKISSTAAENSEDSNGNPSKNTVSSLADNLSNIKVKVSILDEYDDFQIVGNTSGANDQLFNVNSKVSNIGSNTNKLSLDSSESVDKSSSEARETKEIASSHQDEVTSISSADEPTSDNKNLTSTIEPLTKDDDSTLEANASQSPPIEEPEIPSAPIEELKPRKTSKIGLKKPREKIGERLGTKKLGQKIDKPLESLSCDTASGQPKNEALDKAAITEPKVKCFTNFLYQYHCSCISAYLMLISV